MTISDYTSKDIQRFWSKVKIADNDSCWEWQAYRDKEGYGKFGHSRQTLSHRIAWEITNGFIPEGLKILHSCDNPSCVNPHHLFLGTQADNVKDMMLKNRDATHEQRRNPKLGELNPSHKLTREQVNYIRQRYLEGNITHKQLGLEMGVSRQAIGLIVNGKKWSN